MKLEELYKHDEDGKTYIAIGNGGEDLYRQAIGRIGRTRFYSLTRGKIDQGYTGRGIHPFYFLEERDFQLFNAYEDLPEGWDMVGYGDGTTVEDDNYDYGYRPNSAALFAHKPADGVFFEDAIYARKRKEAPKLFKWEKGRLPTEADADVNSRLVSHYMNCNKEKVGLCSMYSWTVKAGMPWARTKDTAHFTADNPAPSPFDQ
jgi:hypothetical protein